MQTSFWLEDPSILFHRKYISQIWPTKNMNKEEKLNAITRIIIIITILLYLITSNIRVILAGGVTICAIIILKYAQAKRNDKSTMEGFNNKQYSTLEENTRPDKSKNTIEEYSKPTETNPLMNVVLPQIQDDPTRASASASYNPDMVEKINTCTQDAAVNGFDNKEDIKNKLFSDLGDSLMFDRSMIQFNSNANTTIPNDQKSFADFCYGDMVSCKEGNAFACERNAPPHWING